MKQENKKPKEKKSPLDFFFSLGDKVTKGDPVRKANWDYYFLWIIFLAFFSILIGNLYEFFFVSQRLANLGWAFVMSGILWFQYHGLKQFYGMRKIMKQNKNKPEKEMKVESVEDMLKEFEK